MLTSKQLFERQEEESYDRFLAENTLYTKDSKISFVDDENAIMNAFMFNFIGILGSFNAARQLNQVIDLRKFDRYFKKEGQLMLKNIGDDNNNISLVLKLMADKKMFISDAKVNEMTRFLVKCKAGVVTTVDDDIVRGWVANVKASAIQQVDPKLRPLITDFKVGNISLIDAAKGLRKYIKQYKEAGAELWKIGQYVRFSKLAGVSTVTVGTAAGNATADPDDDDDNKDQVSQVVTHDVDDDVQPVADTAPVDVDPIPSLPDYMTYDHEEGLFQTIYQEVESNVQSFGLRGLVGLYDSMKKDLKFMPTGFQFDLDDKTQMDMYTDYRGRFIETMAKLYPLGKAIANFEFQDDSSSFYATEDALGFKTDPMFTKASHLAMFRELMGKYTMFNGEIPKISAFGSNIYARLYRALGNVSVDQRSWLFGFDYIDIARELTSGNNFDLIGDAFVASDGEAETLKSIMKMPEAIRQMMFSAAWRGIKVYLDRVLNNSSSSDGVGGSYFVEGLLADFVEWKDYLHEINVKMASYFPIHNYATYGSEAYKRNYYTNGFRMITSPENKYNGDFSYMIDFWNKLYVQDDSEFRQTMYTIGYKCPVAMITRPLRVLTAADTGTLAKCVLRAAKLGTHLGAASVKLSAEIVPSVVVDTKEAILQTLINADDYSSFSDPIKSLIGLGDPDKMCVELVNRLRGTPMFNRKMNFMFNVIGYEPSEFRNKAFLGAYEALGKDFNGLEMMRIGNDKYSNLYSQFVEKYDFEGEDAIAFMKLEIKNGFLLINEENGKEIRIRDHKDRMQQTLVDLLTDAVETDPLVANAFFDHLDDYYQKKVKETLTSVRFVYGQITEGPINLFDTLDRSRIKKMFSYNEISPSKLAKEVKMKKIKGEKFSDYLKRVDDYAKSADGVVPKVKAVDDNITNEQKYLIGKHLVDSYHAGKHGNVYPLIRRSLTVSFSDTEYKKFMQEQMDIGKLQQVVPCFHGTGGIAANMILRFGFKIVPSKDQSVVGRMLGDGIYFSNKIDKILQYVGNSGFGRRPGTKGYVFEMESILGKPYDDYRSAGVPGATQHSSVVSPEWAVYSPDKQLRILKCYEVELNTFNAFKEHQEAMKGTLEESRVMKFGEMLTEARQSKAQDFCVYTFRDGQVPVMKGDELHYAKMKELKLLPGMRVEGEDGDYLTVYIPSKKTEYYDYTMCKKLKGKELTRYLKLTGQI